jgi:hypothetical protein
MHARNSNSRLTAIEYVLLQPQPWPTRSRRVRTHCNNGIGVCYSAVAIVKREIRAESRGAEGLDDFAGISTPKRWPSRCLHHGTASRAKSFTTMKVRSVIPRNFGSCETIRMFEWVRDLDAHPDLPRRSDPRSTPFAIERESRATVIPTRSSRLGPGSRRQNLQRKSGNGCGSGYDSVRRAALPNQRFNSFRVADVQLQKTGRIGDAEC